MVSSPTSPPPEAPSEESLRLGYEPTHISIRALLIAVIGLGVGGVLLGIGVWYIQKDYLDDAARGDRSTSFVHVAPDLRGAPPLQPDGPAHDTTPPQDLAAMHAAENTVFDHMGWRNPQTGEIAVPASITDEIIRAHSTPTTRPTP
jgi:hypothetical protein